MAETRQSNFARVIEKWQKERGPLRIMSASGQLGYGIIEKAFRAGLARALHVIGADMGSVDPGPYYLGSGRMAPSDAIARRDLALVLEAARSLDVPLLIGSAGTGGARAHLRHIGSELRGVQVAVGVDPDRHGLMMPQTAAMAGDP